MIYSTLQAALDQQQQMSDIVNEEAEIQPIVEALLRRTPEYIIALNRDLTNNINTLFWMLSDAAKGRLAATVQDFADLINQGCDMFHIAHVYSNRHEILNLVFGVIAKA